MGADQAATSGAALDAVRAGGREEGAADAEEEEEELAVEEEEDCVGDEPNC